MAGYIRTLLLLRHAEAAPTAPQDRARPLTSRGRIEAEMVARKMLAFKIKPDYVLCSPARRARETFDYMEKVLPSVSVIYPEYLYNASTEDLFNAVRKLTDTAQTALLIGHNPGIHNLATQMASRGDHERLSSMSYGFKPATLAVIQCRCSNWASIEMGENELVQLILPN